MRTSGKICLAATLLLFAPNGCAYFNWQDTKSGLGSNCMWSGLACIPYLGMELYDGAKDLTKEKGYEIDGKRVTPDEVKAQAYQYKPESPAKTDTADAAQTKEVAVLPAEQPQPTPAAQADKPAESQPAVQDTEKK